MIEELADASRMRRNVEIKVRTSSLEEARDIAKRLATEELGMQTQVDTYFHCTHGRLKLREIDQRQFHLIWYTRSDQAAPRPSDYCLVPVTQPELLKQALHSALGTRSVVHKQREVFLYHNVRIHLDDVREVGHFLEFESVLPHDRGHQTRCERVDWLLEAFGIAPRDFVAASYIDLQCP